MGMTNRGTSKKSSSDKGIPCCKQGDTRLPQRYKDNNLQAIHWQDGRALAEKYNAIQGIAPVPFFSLVQQKAKLKRDQDQQDRQVHDWIGGKPAWTEMGARKKKAGQRAGEYCSPIDRMVSVFSVSCLVLSRLFLWVCIHSNGKFLKAHRLSGSW